MGILDRLARPRVFLYEMQSSTTAIDLSIAQLYRTQPNLQAVVSFLADNIAGLPLKVYDRVSDTDRKRVTDSGFAKLLERPNPDMTTFELVRSWSSDMLLFGKAVWLVLEDRESESGWQIRPIPAQCIDRFTGRSPFAPQGVVVNMGEYPVEIPSEAFVAFHNWSPFSLAYGVSPVESLKGMLSEQVEAERYRMQVWKRGGRTSAYISRPKDVKPWSPEQAQRFKDDFKNVFVGDYGSNAGGVPVLEDGMELKSFQLNAREAQWAEAKRFSREDVCAIYHVNPSQIWNTEGQTYASARDNARALYSDTLSPYLRMFAERCNAFLAPKVGASPTEYCEFDLKEKLRGSFEEQAAVIQTAVGAPWMTRNEARAMNNLPAIEGGDELVVPLNLQVGEERKSGIVMTKSEPVRIKAHPDDEVAAEFVSVIKRFMDRQRDAVLPKLNAKASWWDADRWNRELADDLRKLTVRKVAEQARATLERLLIPDIYDADRTEAFIEAMSESRAKRINETTKRELDRAIADGEPKRAFDTSEGRAERSGTSMAAAALGFATLEAIRQASYQGYPTDGAMKTWIVTSSDPRASHATMAGETVRWDEPFSNGAMFPQDLSLPPEEACNCVCEVEVVIP